MTNLKQLTPSELLVLHAQISEELRARGTLRSANSPSGDLAEYLFCKAYGWQLTGPSNPCADATGPDGKLHQIKGRRFTPYNKSRQLGALRGLDVGGFNFLAAVLFTPNYLVARAIIVPHHLVLEYSTYVQHTNSWRFLLRDGIWQWPGIIDATETLREIILT